MAGLMRVLIVLTAAASAIAQTVKVLPVLQYVQVLGTANVTCVGTPPISSTATWTVTGVHADQISFDGPFRNTAILSRLNISSVRPIIAICTVLFGAVPATQSGIISLEVDECMQNPNICTESGHPVNSTNCVNVPGTFACPCRKGYEKNSTGSTSRCGNVNECMRSTHNCGGQSVCVDTMGSFVCQCPDNGTFNGSACVQTHPCLLTQLDCSPRNAMCGPNGTDAVCVCRQGSRFNGSGICADVDECSETLHNCPAAATCRNTAPLFSCECPAGQIYVQAENQCSDVDECLQAPCPLHSRCTNTIGSFQCQCQAGFVANGSICSDINECADPTLRSCQVGVGTECVNTLGSHVCACDMGFLRVNSTYCTDDDECVSGRQTCNSSVSSCSNTVGSFLCPCLPGYTGNDATGDCTALIASTSSATTPPTAMPTTIAATMPTTTPTPMPTTIPATVPTTPPATMPTTPPATMPTTTPTPMPTTTPTPMPTTIPVTMPTTTPTPMPTTPPATVPATTPTTTPTLMPTTTPTPMPTTTPATVPTTTPITMPTTTPTPMPTTRPTAAAASTMATTMAQTTPAATTSPATATGAASSATMISPMTTSSTTDPAPIADTSEMPASSSSSPATPLAAASGDGGLTDSEIGIIIGLVAAGIVAILFIATILAVRKRRSDRKAAVQQVNMSMFNPMYDDLNGDSRAERYTNVTALDSASGGEGRLSERFSSSFQDSDVGLPQGGVTTYQSTDALVDI